MAQQFDRRAYLCKVSKAKFIKYIGDKYGSMVGERVAELLKDIFAAFKGSLDFHEYCDLIGFLCVYEVPDKADSKYKNNFAPLKEICFYCYDLNCDDYISEVDVSAFDH